MLTIHLPVCCSHFKPLIRTLMMRKFNARSVEILGGFIDIGYPQPLVTIRAPNQNPSPDCWNLLESTPARIPLIKSSHKWNQMLFIISNSKLGIWLCSQPRININSKSNFYDVLTIPYKYLSNTLSTLSTKQHALKTIYMLVSPKYGWDWWRRRKH